jgi:hypothetical protein
MAKKKKTQSKTNTSSAETNSFIKGMSKDLNASFQNKQTWYNARNAQNNSVDGDSGTLGNEPGNIKCNEAPYAIIGTIHKQADEWIIYSTDDINSEIGLYDDSKCEYTTLVNDVCLNFNRKNLITGASKENYDCSWQVYWDDNLNPTRTLNLSNIPYKQTLSSEPGADCVVYKDTTVLDCEKLRLAPLVDIPCIKLEKSEDGGQIRNGTYQAYIAYALNGQVVTDFIGISNLQSIFDHDELAGSLKITLTDLDKDFEEFQLVILSNTNQQIVASQIGLYSTQTSSISLDYIDPEVSKMTLQALFKRTPAYEKSESMYVVNDYLIRQGPTEQFDFNYQPLANQIKTEWVVAEYPTSYYYDGGSKTNFMRDEQYAFFIRWIYNTGERSASYHIPGRAARFDGYTGNGISQTGSELDLNAGAFDTKRNWQTFNTASWSQNLNIPTDEGGTIIAKGDMGFWQSSERYPLKPEIWNASHIDDNGVNIGGTTLTDFDLCGKHIRHHKMPSEETHPSLELNNKNSLNITKDKIRLLGVQFSNIKRPLFNDGTVIPNIVGYEILRGSRRGAKSILAKGIFRNMRQYEIPEEFNPGNKIGLFPNYPYNDLGRDYYFHTGTGTTGKRTEGLKAFENWIPLLTDIKAPPLEGFRRDVFTFHSPELMFKRPFLSAYETRFYGKVKGFSQGYFTKSEEHPQQKLLLNNTLILAIVIGFGYAIGQMTKTQTQRYLPTRVTSGGLAGFTNTIPGVAPIITSSIWQIATSALDFIGAVDLADALSGNIVRDALAVIGSLTSTATLGQPGAGAALQVDYEDTQWTRLPGIIKAAFAVPGLLMYLAQGGDEIIQIFYNLMSTRDYTLKHNSHGLYDQYEKLQPSTTFRTKVIDSSYTNSTFQNFGDSSEFKINNLFRPDTVSIQIDKGVEEPFYNFTNNITEDSSRYTLGQQGSLLPSIGGNFEDLLKKLFTDLNDTFEEPICSLYGALKFDFDNQYGQLEGIKQVVMRGCIEDINQDDPKDFLYASKPIFSGDTYINRYTEKTVMPIFTDFLLGQPDEFVFDYLKYTNIPYPRYHINSERYRLSDLFSGIFGLRDMVTYNQQGDPLGKGDTQHILPGSNNSDFTTILPSDLYCLDVPKDVDTTSLSFNPIDAFQSLYGVSLGYMYSHVSGIQDFFVESEVNIAQRDWDDTPEKRHYDTYTYNNINDLFNARIIKKDNFFKYDTSLSASNFITNLSNYGVIQQRDYDPLVAEKCFTFYPKRLIYSLRAQEEARKDFWRVFLPNNYKDFKDKVSVIKPINQTGALMFFPYRSPKAFLGVDQLQTDLGTKIILGDGGLFAREPKNIVNSDLSNEYGSCESARSVINTPSGVYFISQAQGKIFNYSGKLQAISNLGLKWWFNKYLPSILIRQFPELEYSELGDNPVIGVGCQSVYDVNNDIVYFMKKDYSVKEYYKDFVEFDSISCKFFYNDGKVIKREVKLTDEEIFENVSWTVSYDPKIKGWVSFHDWHPELSLPSINHFLTTVTLPNKKPYCPPNFVYNEQTRKCEQLITESAPSIVTVDEKEAVIIGNTCMCEDPNYTLIYPDPQNNFQYTLDTGDCITQNTEENITVIPGNGVPNSVCNCFEVTKETAVPASITQIQYVTCNGQIITESRDSNNIFPASLGCIRFDTLTGTGGDPKPYYVALSMTPCNTYSCCSCNEVVITNLGAKGSSFSYVDCDGNTKNTNFTDGPGSDIPLPCIIANTIILTSGGPVSITVKAECRKYDCGPTRIVETTVLSEYKALCRKVTCECPEAAPNTVTTTTGVCDDVYNIIRPDYYNPNPIICNYFTELNTTPSFIRGGLWRHNYRCDLYANYYGISYPWEVEIIENTGQTVNTLRSVEYQLESYVYKGDLINGCGDDRWHDLDFNFDEAIISNSEQVSGLLRLELNPKEDPFNILKYPIISGQDIKILYSKEEQKYRFNQFWDITNDRGEFSNAEQNIFITRLNGYIKDLNVNNLNYDKPSEERKKFRHYYNRLLLRRNVSDNRKMLLKLNNTKLNLSFR